VPPHRQPQHGAVRRASADGRVGRAARNTGGDDARLRRGGLPRGGGGHRRRAPGARRRRSAGGALDGALRSPAALPGLPRIHHIRVLTATEVTHPLVRHKLGLLRDRDTDTEMFRRLVNELTLLLTYEAT